MIAGRKRLGNIVSLAAALLLTCAGSEPGIAGSSASLGRDGSLNIAGRKLRCGTVQSRLDARLPILGIAVPHRALLVINPVLLARETQTVRLFVFHHECGHHHVGGDELKADCWAVGRGLREGWLTRAGLSEVCTSFRDMPAAPRYPSAARRCVNLERCFTSVEASFVIEASKVGYQNAPSP